MDEYHPSGVQRLVDKITDTGQMDEEVLHFCVIEVDGEVVGAARGPVLQNGHDVRDFVLGEKLRFDRGLETCEEATIGQGERSVFFVGRGSWRVVRTAIRTFRDTAHLGGCNLGPASGGLNSQKTWGERWISVRYRIGVFPPNL